MVVLQVIDHVFEQIGIGPDRGMLEIRRAMEAEHDHPAGRGLLHRTDETLHGHAHAAHGKRGDVKRVVHGGPIDAAITAASEYISPIAQERIEFRVDNIKRPGERRRFGNPVGDHFVFQGPHVGLATADIGMR